MHPMLTIAVRAARKAGKLILKSQETPDSVKIDRKGDFDFATNVDRATEALITETIKRSYPDHTIIGEESGLLPGSDGTIEWIIDPIDGTTNFIKGFPHYSVSIAARVNNRTEIGVIYDPMLNELFTAVRGQGAQLNGYRLRVSNYKDLQGIIIGTGFPFKNKKYSSDHFRVLEKLFLQCADFRRTGSAALDLAYVAAGRTDCFFEIGLKPWDIAAGELIIRESGGIATDFSGGTNYLTSGNIVAANPKVLKAFIAYTHNEWADSLK